MCRRSSETGIPISTKLLRSLSQYPSFLWCTDDQESVLRLVQLRALVVSKGVILFCTLCRIQPIQAYLDSDNNANWPATKADHSISSHALDIGNFQRNERLQNFNKYSIVVQPRSLGRSDEFLTLGSILFLRFLVTEDLYTSF